MAGVLGALGTGAVIAITIKAIDEFSDTFNNAVSGTDRLSSVMKLGVGAVVAFGATLVAVGVSSLKVAADFEQTQVAFTTMLGSAEEADAFLKQLADFAKKTPFTLVGVEQAAKQLMAVGFESENVLPVLKSVGDVASGLGLGQEGLSRLILNLGQVQAQGKLTGRELRDFAVAGIPMLDELGKELGKTTAEIQEMVSGGEIDTATVLKVFENMTSEGGRFANLMAKQAETVKGKFSNLQDTWELMQREIGKAFIPAIAALADVFLEDLLPALQPLIPILGEFFANALKEISPLLIELVPIVGDLIKNLMPLMSVIVQLGVEIGKVLTEVFNALLPTINALIPVIIKIFEAFKPLIPIIADIYVLFADLISVVMSELMPTLEPLIPVIAELAKTILTAALQVLQQLMPSIIALIPVLAELLQYFTPLIPVISKILEVVVELMGLGLGILAGMISTVLVPILNIMATVFDFVGEKIEWVTDIIVTIIGWIEKLVGWISKISFGVIGKIADLFGGDNDTHGSKGGRQLGGEILESGNYYMHRGEMVTPSREVNNGGNVTVIIEGNIYGTDPDEMVEAFASKMRQQIRI